MPDFEYKVLPAPHHGTKAKGVKSTEDRFALSLTNALNEEAGEGWEYVRAETLPCEERKGLTGTQTSYQNVLVFRRVVKAAATEAKPEPLTLRTPSQPTLVAATAAPVEAPARDEPPLRRFSKPPEPDTADD